MLTKDLEFVKLLLKVGDSLAYILQDKKDKRMYYKGTDNAYGRHAYTYIESNALVFDNYEEACMVAEDIKADVIHVKVGQQKKKQTKKKVTPPKKEVLPELKIETKEDANGQLGFNI